MAKSKKLSVIDKTMNYIEPEVLGITDTLESNYMPYAMSVILSRALPEIDGFKPSHRKLLYTMYKMKLINGARTKSANVVGQTMKLNPHGDQAIYATMVRLSRGHDALIHPYVDSKGNFGKSTSRDMQYAASRYTEVKLDSIAKEIFNDIDKNTVDFVDNYDGQLKEPLLLPTTFPNILVNANKGIAVGMASSICSFNLTEVCEATIAYMKNPDVDLLDILKAPDLSTGACLLYERDKMRSIYETGTGSFKLRAKYQYVKKDNCIEITEIPYTATIEQIMDKIVDLVKKGTVRELSDIRDETDLSGLKITLDLKRGTNPDKLMAKLFRYTPLEDSFSCNFNVLINGKPQVLGIKGILLYWLEFRKTCIKRQLRYDVTQLDKTLHLLKGLAKVLLDIDKAIKIIRETESEKQVVPNLMAEFDVDEIQAEYVADIKLRNINREYILRKTKDIEKLENEKQQLLGILNSEKKIEKRIEKELQKIAKNYGKPRRTDIVNSKNVMVHSDEVFISNYAINIFFTDHNYIKKITPASLRGGSEHKLKDDDVILQQIEAENKDEILFFSNRYNVYKLKAYELSDHKASDLGTYLPNLLEMEDDEIIKYIVVTNDFKGYMLFAYENGKIAKVPLSIYETKTNRKKLVKAYSDFSPLVDIKYIANDVQLGIIRYYSPDEYRLLIISTQHIAEKNTKNTRGVQVVRIKKGSVLEGIFLIDDFMLNDSSVYEANKIPLSGTVVDLIDRTALLEFLDKKRL